MPPDHWPSDAQRSAALLARIVRSIEHRSRAEADELLVRLLWWAWPTLEAQDQ